MTKLKITYEEIGNMINRKETGMKAMKQKNPEQLEITKIGALCKKYNITIEDLTELIKKREL